MLTVAQQNYLKTIPEDKVAVMKPWDPRSQEVAKRLITEIQSADSELEVFYNGASALGLPGVNDIDFILICPKENFNLHLPNLKNVLGDPAKIGEESVKWKPFQRDSYQVEVYMTGPDSPAFKEHLRLFELLKNDERLKNEYQKLKEEANGLPYREYQRRKYEFYNKVLELK